MKRPLYQHISARLAAMENCRKANNAEWERKHEFVLDKLVREHMPSGSGIDSGTKLAGDSTPDRLVFDTSFHHMNEAGMYDGWTDHTVIVTPSLNTAFNLRVTGRNRNDIKDLLADVFQIELSKEVDDADIRHDAFGGVPYKKSPTSP